MGLPVGVVRPHLVTQIQKEVTKKSMELTGSLGTSAEEINNVLDYGFVEAWTLNET